MSNTRFSSRISLNSFTTNFILLCAFFLLQSINASIFILPNSVEIQKSLTVQGSVHVSGEVHSSTIQDLETKVNEASGGSLSAKLTNMVNFGSWKQLPAATWKLNAIGDHAYCTMLQQNGWFACFHYNTYAYFDISKVKWVTNVNKNGTFPSIRTFPGVGRFIRSSDNEEMLVVYGGTYGGYLNDMYWIPANAISGSIPGEWTSVPHTTVPGRGSIYLHTTYDNRMWMYGGQSSTVLSGLFRFDPNFSGTKQWVWVGNTLNDIYRKEVLLTSEGDYLYIMGGYYSGALLSNYKYGPISGAASFTALANGPSTGFHYGALGHETGSDWIYHAFGCCTTNKVFRYSISTNTWEDISTLVSGAPTARDGIGFGMYGGALFAMGGWVPSLPGRTDEFYAILLN